MGSTGNQRLNRIALGSRDAVSVKMRLAKGLPVNNNLIRGLESRTSRILHLVGKDMANWVACRFGLLSCIHRYFFRIA